jgi:hypothetical protein
MFHHFVMLRIPESSDREEAARLLRGLQGVVPSIRTLDVRLDTLGDPGSVDLLLHVVVEDEAAYRAYESDPIHVGVKTQLKAMLAKGEGGRWAVDYTD